MYILVNIERLSVGYVQCKRFTESEWYSRMKRMWSNAIIFCKIGQKAIAI